MKKILIIVDGPIGESYIKRIMGMYANENLYYIIQPNHHHDIGGSARFKFFHFDPTSRSKMIHLLKMDFWQVLLVMENRNDLNYTLENIRFFKPSLRVVALDLWNLPHPNESVEWINLHELIAINLIDYLPNIPVLAKNIGLSMGEIMEVLVPFGSSFAYRHLGSIEQKNWRVAAMYKNRSLILPTEETMIHPNDTLILVGDPVVLHSIYRAIKRELGQFPAPFGRNLYLYIDMARDRIDRIMPLVRRAIYIQKKLHRHLSIRVVNPSSVDVLRMIKASIHGAVSIEIHYGEDPRYEILSEDIKNDHVGLCLVSYRLFRDQKVREALYKAHIPVLKLAHRSFASLKESVVIITEEGHVEHISTAVFDLSAQLGFNVELIDYLNEEREHKEKSLEHFRNLSAIFSKGIRIESLEHNPIKWLYKRSDFLHILPFTTKIIQPRWKNIFSTDPEALYYELDTYHQLFIPTQV